VEGFRGTVLGLPYYLRRIPPPKNDRLRIWELTVNSRFDASNAPRTTHIPGESFFPTARDATAGVGGLLDRVMAEWIGCFA